MLSGKLISRQSATAPLTAEDLPLAWQCLSEVMDPEVPVVSVVDLGMVRDLDWVGDHIRIKVSPTYSGCPATDLIEQSIAQALAETGFLHPEIERVLTPAWTTDWITPQGRERLRLYGIAPPAGSGKRSLMDDPVIRCPHCGSEETEIVSEFGSTACKALYRCRSCLEPFDYFKCI